MNEFRKSGSWAKQTPPKGSSQDPPPDLPDDPPPEEEPKDAKSDTLQERLQKLESDLKEADVRIEQYTKSKKSLGDDIKALQTIKSELEQTLTGYGDGYGSVEKEYLALQDFGAAKWHVVQCALGEAKVAEIKKHIQTNDEHGKKYEAARAAAWKKHKDADKALEEAKKAEAEARVEYDKYKGYLKWLTNRLKEFAELRKEIEAQSAKDNAASMYILLVDLGDGLEEAKPLSKDELAAKLREAWQALYEAKTQTRAREREAFDAKAAYEKAKTAFDEHKKHRKANLLQAVAHLNKKNGGAQADQEDQDQDDTEQSSGDELQAD